MWTEKRICSRTTTTRAGSTCWARASSSRNHEAQVPLRGIEGLLGGKRRGIPADFLLAVDDAATAFDGVREDATVDGIPVPRPRARVLDNSILDVHGAHDSYAFWQGGRARDGSNGRLACRVTPQCGQIAAEAIDHDVVLLVQLDVSGAAEHEEGDVGRCGRPRAQRIPNECDAACLGRAVLPLSGNEVVMRGARTGVVDEIVDDQPACAALEERIPLVVVCVEIADDQHIAHVVVDQAALRMLALGV